MLPNLRRNPLNPTLALLGLVTLWLLPALGHAQTQEEPETTQFEDWELICFDAQGGERCQMQQTLQIDDPEVDGLYVQASLHRDGDRHVLEILLPLGVELRPGILLQIDDGEEFRGEFIACVQQGCAAAREIGPERLQELRGGRNLSVAFRALHMEQPLAFDLSLMGFTDASERLR
ncbi:MAG: invasion associated locus B family protein [Pseudomonadota bacterium]